MINCDYSYRTCQNMIESHKKAHPRILPKPVNKPRNSFPDRNGNRHGLVLNTGRIFPNKFPKRKWNTRLGMKKRNFFIYLLKSHDLYKVGYAFNLESRMSSYRTHNPQIDILNSCVYCGDPRFGFEAQIRRDYEKSHIRGEWYR